MRSALLPALAVVLLSLRGDALTLHHSFRTRDVGFGGGFGASVPVDAKIDKAIDEARRDEAFRERVLVGRVTRVTDGNSFRMVTGGGTVARVRLAGVLAPTGDEPNAAAAAAHLKKLIHGFTVRVAYNSQDQFGNLWGDVTVGKLSVNRRMVADGFARACE